MREKELQEEYIVEEENEPSAGGISIGVRGIVVAGIRERVMGRIKA